MSNASSNGTTAAVNDQSLCESVDYYLSITVLVASLALLGSARSMRDRKISVTTSLPSFPFFVLIANHFYVQYGHPWVSTLPISESISRYTPAAVGFLIMWLSAVGRRTTVTFVVAGVVAYFVSTMAPTWSISTVVVTTVVFLLFLEHPAVRLYISELITIIVAITTFLVLLLGVWTPDPETCGHPRNKLALCTPACGTITTDFTLYLLALLVGIGAIVGVLIGSAAYRYLKKETEEQKRVDATAAAIALANLHPEGSNQRLQPVGARFYAAGEEGSGMEYLHRARASYSGQRPPFTHSWSPLQIAVES